ncbi:MAG: hypothetical protein QM661_09420 [Solimonas sp.]
MPLDWNEIRGRSPRFSREWKDESSEDTKAKPFLRGFFEMPGVAHRRVALRAAGDQGRWQGRLHRPALEDILPVEHKPRAKDLDHAFRQVQALTPPLPAAKAKNRHAKAPSGG